MKLVGGTKMAPVGQWNGVGKELKLVEEWSTRKVVVTQVALHTVALMESSSLRVSAVSQNRS